MKRSLERIVSFAFRATTAAVLTAAVLTGGCTDMPVVAPPPGEEQPIGKASLTLGPYLTSGEAKQPQLRFVTNRRCVAGLQALGTGDKRVNRQGSFSLYHGIQVPDISSKAPRRYQLWLDDINAGVYEIKGLPPSGQAVAIAFLGGASQPSFLAPAADLAARNAPDASVLVSSPFRGGQTDRPEDAAREFFAALGNAVALGSLWFAPGSNAPSQLFPELAEEGGYWKRDVGALRIIGIDVAALSFDSSRTALMRRLDTDLDPQRRQRQWTVVVLSRPAFDARKGDGRILQGLGDKLEAGGVDLVIGGGAEYYLRTRPFAIGGTGQTRYISLADATAGSASGVEPREYVAMMSGTPHVARLWADAGTLEWQVTDLAGRPLDSLKLDFTRPGLEPALPKWDIIADAQSTLTLQKELLRITRQAARATSNPDAETMLALHFANPSTRQFRGRLSWDMPADSRWRVEPREMPFDLQPGQAAIARFRVTPAGGASSPFLTAVGQDVGTARDALILTSEKRLTVHPAPSPVRIDARLRDKDYWNTLPPLADFVLAGGGTPTNPIEGRVVADRQGLVVALSMAGRLLSSVSPTASDPDRDRDGQVLSDESVEIWLDPGRKGRDYYHFALNPRSVPLDESSRDGMAYNPDWQRASRFGRVAGQETWDVEMRIPWEALGRSGPPPAGEEWGLEVIRNDYSAARVASQARKRGPAIPPEKAEWTQTFGQDGRSGLYGVLTFGDMASLPTAPAARTPTPTPGIRGTQLPTAPGGGFLPPPSEPVAEPPVPDF